MKWRDMEVLLKTPRVMLLWGFAACIQGIGMPLEPWGIGDFGDNSYKLIIVVVAQIKADRIEKGADAA